jgi:hypothetical protein
MAGTEVKTGVAGTIGYMHEIETKPDSMLVFQVPRRTEQMSNSYMESIKDAIHRLYPDKQILIIGCDVNLYELAGSDALCLKLKGLI